MMVVLGTLILLFLVSQTSCIDILRFDDPLDRPSEEFKIGNISDDNYEIVLNFPEVPFPTGQDLTICYRWYFDQIRFEDPGLMGFHMKLYMNKSDEVGKDAIVKAETRTIPRLSGLNLQLKDFIANKNWPHLKELKKATWFNNLNADFGVSGFLRPKYWRSFCHLMDWKNKRQSLVIDGRSLFSWNTKDPNSDHFADDDEEWPQGKLTSISFGPKFKDVSDGKIIGNFTDLNIFSSNIGNKTAEDITGSVPVLWLPTV